MSARDKNNNNPPSWLQLIDKGISLCTASSVEKKEMQKLKKSGDYLGVCQIIKDRLGHDWVKFLQQEISTPEFKYSHVHEKIISLDCSTIITPNFDRLLESCAAKITDNSYIVKHYYDDDIPRILRGDEKQRVILKIHGCIHAPDKIVLSRKEYADIRNKYSNFYRAVDALIFTHTFLFLGCGLKDPDLALVLEQYARSFGAAPPHYLAFSDKVSNQHKSMIEKNYNLSLLNYSARDNHIELEESIKNLEGLVTNRRNELSAANIW